MDGTRRRPPGRGASGTPLTRLQAPPTAARRNQFRQSGGAPVVLHVARIEYCVLEGKGGLTHVKAMSMLPSASGPYVRVPWLAPVQLPGPLNWITTLQVMPAGKVSEATWPALHAVPALGMLFTMP